MHFCCRLYVQAFIEAGSEAGQLYLANKYNIEDDGFEILATS